MENDTTSELESLLTCPWTGIPYWQIGVVVAVLAVILYLIAGYRRKHKPLRVMHDEHGEALISVGALNDLVHLVCEKIGAAGKPRMDFRPRGEHLNVRVRIKLFEDQRLESMRQQLRERVIETFRDTHGIQVGEVDILVTGFKKRASAPPHHAADDPGNA